MISLCSSVFFALLSIATWCALLTVGSYDVLVALLIGLPLSVGGSVCLAFVPTLVLRYFVNVPAVRWSLWISGVSAAIGILVWILIGTIY